MERELGGDVLKRVKRITGIETFLILLMPALRYTIVPRSVRTDEFVADTEIGLDTFNFDTPAGILFGHSVREIGGGVGRLFMIGRQKAKPCKLIDGGILEEA